MNQEARWTKRALKELETLDRRLQERILGALDRLVSEARGDTRRLQGMAEAVYRLRVGDWRVIFTRDQDGAILVLRVRPRGSAYEP